MKDSIQKKVHIKFAEILDKIKVNRIKNGVDNKLKSDRRLTLGIIRHSLWKEIEEDLSKLPMEEE